MSPQGFPEQVYIRLLRCRERYLCGLLSESSVDSRLALGRLVFARWLRDHGRLTDELDAPKGRAPFGTQP